MDAFVPPRHEHAIPRLRHAAATIAAALGLAAVFIFALVFAALVHLNVPAAHHLAQKAVNSALDSALPGAVRVESIQDLGLRHLVLSGVRVYDPRGEQVAWLSVVEARYNALAMAKEALFGTGALDLTIDSIAIGHADILLERTPSGQLSLIEAFESSEPTKPSQPPGRPLALTIHSLRLDSAWVHGEVAPPRAVDADVHDLKASVEVLPERIGISLSPTFVHERSALPADVAGMIEGQMISHEGRLSGKAGFDGRLGGVELGLRAAIDGDHVEARARAPRVTPAELSTLVENPPLTRPVTAVAEVAGDLPRLGFNARVFETDAQAHAIHVEGTLLLDGTVSIDVRAETQKIDPSLFAESAPKAAIDARMNALVALGEGGPRVVAHAFAEPFVMKGQRVPAVEAHAVYDEDRLTGVTRVYEEGVDLSGYFRLDEDKTARFDVVGDIPSLRAAPRLAGPLGGSAHVRASGRYGKGALDARIESLFSLRPGSVDLRVRRGTLEGSVHGPLDDLSIDAALRGAGVSFRGYRVDRLNARAQGSLDDLQTRLDLRSPERHIAASARLDVENKSARRVAVDLRRGDETATLRAGRIAAAGGGVRVDNLSLRGENIGELGGSLALSRRGLTGDLHADTFDLGGLVALAGAPVSVDGIASFDIALRRGERGPEGHVELLLENGAYRGLRGLSANLTVQMDGRDLGVDLGVDGYLRLINKPSPKEPTEAQCNGTAARVQISKGRFHLAGPLTAARTWREAFGSAEVFAESESLGCLVRGIPAELPESLGAIAGAVKARLDLARAPGERLATVRDFALATQDLALSGPVDKDTGAPAWTSRSLDVGLRASLDSESGAARGEVYLYDRAPLAELSFATKLDIPALISKPARRERALLDTPIAAHLSLPRRPIASYNALPTFLRDAVPALEGRAGIDVYAAGTARAPRVVVRATGLGLDEAGDHASAGFGPPIDLDAYATYDGKKATLDAFVLQKGTRIAEADGHAELPIGALLDRQPGRALPWSAGIALKLDGLPLGKLPYLAERDIAGSLVGRVDIEGLNTKPTISAHLSAQDLQLSRDVFFEDARVALDVGPAKKGRATADLAADFVAYDGGELHATGDLGLRWQGAAPSLDRAREARLSINADRFRLAAAQPFLGDALSKLDGYLDGQLAVDWAKPGEVREARVEGELHVSHGYMVIPSLGQTLSDMRFALSASPKGEIRLEGLEADAADGRLLGAASARLSGLDFISAAATLQIPRGQDVPLTVTGNPVGEISGTVEARVWNEPRALVASVDVSNLRIELPPSLGKSVQPLEDNPDIDVHPPIEPPEEEEPGAVAGKPMRLTVRVGETRIKGSGVDATIRTSTPLSVEVDHETRIGGNIQVLEGKVEVLGKVFKLEHGLVHMRPDAEPSNPYVNVGASWDSPDGTRVFIDYIGNLKPITGKKLKLRSDPPRSESQIMALILLGPERERGTVAGTAAAGAGKSFGEQAGGTAASLGTAYASGQLNAILAGIKPLQGLQVKLGTSEKGALETRIGYKLSETLTASASYEVRGLGSLLGAPGGAANLSARGTEFGLEWRFRRNFSLRGTIGMGPVPATSLDVLWTKRY